MKESVAIIMPVYNEEGAIAKVLTQWLAMLDSLSDAQYQIHVYNDGSRDGTGRILQENASLFGNRVVVHDKPNSGHGPTILLGYRENAATVDWLFQIDSDGEIGPEKFSELWNMRQSYDFLIGHRQNRASPLPRRIISLISRWAVWIFYGRGVHDVNCPFRLMRSSVLQPFLREIPPDTFAPNVVLSGLACRSRWRIFQVPVLFSARQTGEVSIKKWKLFKAAVKSFAQTIAFARRIPDDSASRGATGSKS